MNFYLTQVLHTLHWGGAVRNGLLESKCWGIPRGGQNWGPAPPTASDSFASQLPVEAGRRGPICRHSGLGGDSAFYLCREFKSLFPPGQRGAWCPFLEGVQ